MNNKNENDIHTSIYINGSVFTIPQDNNGKYIILYVKFNKAYTSTICLGSTFMGRGFVGQIGEFICLNDTHTDVERIKLEGYLAKKWNLQNELPGNHMFKNI